VQPLIDLYHGDRVLRLRVRTAWVVGSLERIPFLDLPQLGGASLLRGYGGGRFRGRGTVLASAEYRYPVQQNIAGYLFVDAGRAYVELAQLGASSLRGARVGFGGGLYAFTTGALLLRAQLASSIDGGLFLALRLDTSDGLGDTY
jgi:outer membrane protein assembly factor BamA